MLSKQERIVALFLSYWCCESETCAVSTKEGHQSRNRCFNLHSQCCQISRFGKFKRRLTAEPLKITKHVGYVLDHSRAEQSKDGVNYRYLKVIHCLKLRDSQNLATVCKFRICKGHLWRSSLDKYCHIPSNQFGNEGQGKQEWGVNKP